MPQFTTVVDALQHQARELGDTAAFISRDRYHGRHVLTWADLYTLAGRFAALLRAGGLGRGGLVVNTLLNSPERVVSEAGVWLSGAATVNGQCLLSDGSDLLRTIRVSSARAILVDPDVTDSPWNVLKNHVTLDGDDNVTSGSLPDLKKVYFVRRVEGRGQGDFLGRLEALHDSFQADDVNSDDVLCVFTTSGTTGFSKLVVYTHGSFTHNMHGQMDSTGETVLKSLGSYFSVSPLGWVGGFPGISIVQGTTRLMCDVRAGGIPEDMAEFIYKSSQNEKSTSIFLPPMYLPRLVELDKADRERKIKDSMSGPGTPPARLFNKIFLGGLPVNRYMVQAGLTLANSVVISYGATDFGLVSGLKLDDSQGYVDYDTGPPLKDVEVRIVSQNDKEMPLPTNQVGNILIKRPSMMRCYLNDPQATADAFTKDGFFRTGDVGRLDERGHLLVEGRGSDAIMRGPYIFYPSWLETRITACPGVREVLIVGVPDPYLHEEICACVVFDSDDVTMEQVRHFVEKDIVASEDNPLSPRPRYYLRFESFVRTITDKLKRKEIKAQAAERLNLSYSC